MAKESWYWLANGLGWGAVNSGELLEAYPGGADEIYADLGSEKLDELLTQKQADRLAATRPEDFSLRIHQAKSQGIEVLCLEDSGYPEALRTIHNPPMLLFVKGDAGLLNGQLSIGMVGARRPSAYGVEAVKAIGRGVALGGAIIVSGLAAGLDAEAHKAALAVNGPTIACIAFGHNHCYPAANKKLMEVIERYGAVISEYPPDTTPEKPYFLQRNRLIAGLGHGLVVIEARRHSGTMSTVNFAVDFGRDVFAVPGSIFSELSGGTNAMIQEGAYVAGSATDVLGVYGIELKGEDPVATAAKQAGEGRPAPASATPPWQQSIRRFEHSRQAPSEEREPLPGQQSLGELLRGQLKDSRGEISAAQAVDAFRALQNSMPAATDSELDARNRALDELVEAVSDSVQISDEARRSSQKKGKPPPPRPGEPQPFPWHQVERLDKSEVEDLSPARSRPARRKQKPAAQPVKAAVATPPEEDDLSGASTSPPAAFLQRFAGSRNTAQAAMPGPIERVGRVEPFARVQPVGPVQPVSPFTTVAPVAMAATPAPSAPAQPQPAPQAAAESPPAPVPAQPEAPAGIPVPDMAPPEKPAPDAAEVLPRRDFVPRPVAERPAERPRADSSLSGRLKTLQAPAEKPRPAAGRTDTLVTSRRPAASSSPLVDTGELLSETAQKALAQLGPVPVPLDEICKRSGLSPAEAMAALTELELAGLSRQMPGRQFVII